MLLLLIYFTPPVAVMGQVVSGTTYNTTASGAPTGWSYGGSFATGNNPYKYLTSSSDYIQTSSFIQNGFSSIVLKARKYGGPSNDQALITVSWYDATTSEETVLGTVTPSSTSLANCTISSPTNPTGNTSGYIKIQCKAASESKGSGVSQVTITYTAGSGSSTYTVTYNANGATSGTVPTDATEYDDGNNTVTVLGNTGDLAKTHYTFGGWNTKADGTGTNYTAGNTFTISASTTLYAKWNGNTHDISMPTANTYGSYTASATSSVAYGTTVTLTYTPATGYDDYEATWSVNGEAISGNTFSMPDENVTVTVSVAEVIDYATLPFSWAGGSSSDFTSLTGVTANGLGSDYASGNSPYLIKFDGTGDYIQVKTDSQPGTVTVKVKMLGGTSTSTITVQGSADGETFTKIDDLSISGSSTSTELTLETTNSFASTDRFVRLYFTKGSNVGVGPITISKYVEKYAITVTQPGAGGTIAADKTEAEAGATITLTPTPDTHYNFTSWSVYKTGDPGTTVTVTDNQFTMPAYPVTVTATFTAMTIRTITIPAAIEDNVIVDATSNQAYAGDEVTITVEAPTGEFLTALTVTGSTSGDAISISPAVSSDEDTYTFTMPDENVSIAATFGSNYTVQFSVNGTIDGTLEQTVTAGQSIATLPTSVTTPTGYTFAGWTADETSTATILTGSYTPSANVTLYAVFAGSAVTKTYSFTISTSDFNTTSYAANNNEKTSTATATTGETMDVKWTSNQIMLQSSAMQWQSSNGYLYNSTDLGTITSVEITSTSGTFTTYYGTAEQPSSGDAGTGKGFFKTSVGSSIGKTSQMVITFQKSFTPNYTLIKDINSAETMSGIYGTYLVTVKDGGVLTLNGANNGSLIIEDGGQLVTSIVVNATVKKSITAYTSADDGWSLISSPVNVNLGAAGIGLTTETTYDLYYLDEGNSKWINYKSTTGNNFSIAPQKGYLYANAANTTLNFSGNLQPNIEAGLEISLAKAGEGWNLVGNPFPFNAYVDKSYYVINGRTVEAYAGSAPVPTCTGIIVKATGADNEKVTFRRTSFAANATNNGNIQLTLAEQVVDRDGTSTGSATLDNAIVSFNEGSELGKFYFGTQNANIYIPQGNEEYAIAYSEGQGEMPINFKVAQNGTYTLSVNAEGVEMDYLHLIDNLTGADVDLLPLCKGGRGDSTNPSYTFEAKTTDYESRFRLVFSICGDANGDNDGDNAPFAFISNGEIVITANTQNATLQIVDAMGRVVVCTDGVHTVSTNGMTAGVYVLRLISGENVRTQKMVVR